MLLSPKKQDRMLKKLRVKNFKCFREEKEFDFGRITLLLGANSSGKSSVMYAILGAIQSGEFPFQFSPNGKYVNMGDYRDMVWGHDVEREIEIGLETMVDGFEEEVLQSKCNSNWRQDSRTLPQLARLSLVSNGWKLKISDEKPQRFILEESSEIPPIEDYSTYLKLLEYSVNEWLSKRGPIEFQIEDVGMLARDFEFRKDDVGEGLASILQAYAKVGADVHHAVNSAFSNWNFISSFRLHPERTYYESTKSDLRVEKFGEGYLDQIMLWDAKYPEKTQELLHWMQEMELITDLKANRIGGGRYDVQVKTKEKGVFAALSDVGFGLSQFLPILVADIQLPEDSTLFIQQPESQLHPSVQANFGDYLTKRVNETQKNYMVETHSEYLLNRIRLNIVKGILKPEDLQVYFLESEEDDTAVHKITFAKDGQIIGAPDSFFTTYEMDVMEIAMNAGE
jgi:predicted ATPase